MKHALLAVVAVAALAFPGLAATATTKTHASSASHPTRATTKGKPVRRKMAKPVHQMLGAVPPFIRTGPGVGQGHVLKGRSPRPMSEIPRPVTDDGLPNAGDNLTWDGPDQIPPKALASLPRVMTYNTNYNIYWVPDGYRQASNYQSVIDQYFNDVAQESGTSDNVDSPAVQYWGSSNDGPIFYDSTFGGSAVDTNPYPKAACSKSMSDINALADTQTDPLTAHIHTLGETTCLSDTQIQAEVKKFADSQGWPHGPNTEFFVYTAHNVGSCFYSDGKVPDPLHPGKFVANVNNVCAYDYYCAYHSEFGTSTKTEYIYANMPWPNQAYEFHAASSNTDPYKKSDCDGGEHPNGTGSVANGTDPQGATDADAADEVLGVTSHEHNESVTDPTGYGWWDDSYDGDGNPTYYNGYENGDLCAWNWSNAPLGDVTDNNSFFTNELNGNYYFTQGEWSNANADETGWSGCVWSHDISTPSPSDDAVLSTSGDTPPVPGDTLTMTGGDYPAGTALEFEWLRCKPEVSMAAVKAAAVKHTANRFSTDPCTIVADDFSADNTAPADDYPLTNKDVHMDVISVLLGWDGTDPDVQFGFMTIGGEPINTGGDNAPSISLPDGVESPMVGTKLTANVGTWSGNPTSFTGAWQRCTGMSLDTCKTFKSVSMKPSAPTTTYTLVAADAKYGINFLVTAKNALGASDPASSGITSSVGGVPTPNEDTGPSWTGEPLVGTANTLDFGTWDTPDGAPVTAYSGTIRRCAVVNDEGTEVVDLSNCEGNTPFSGTPTKDTASYTPVQADDSYFLVAFVTAKNKYGTSFSDPVNAGIVGGHPTLQDEESGPTVTEDSSPAAPGDHVHLNVGTWLGSPSGYRLVEYICFDPTDTTQCSQWTSARVYAPDTSIDFGDKSTDPDQNYVVPDLSQYEITDYWVRFDVMAINTAGFSADVWSDAGEVVSPS